MNRENQMLLNIFHFSRKTLKWIWINLEIGALSFGSSGRALLYQDAVVEKEKWLTNKEFQEVFTITQVLPGPNLLNLAAYLGYRLVGYGGAWIAILGLTLPGALLLVAFDQFFGHALSPSIEAFFKGVSIASITLFLVLIAKMIGGLKRNIDQNTVSLSKHKQLLRYTLAILVGIGSLAKIPIQMVLLSGLVIGIILEFKTK